MKDILEYRVKRCDEMTDYHMISAKAFVPNIMDVMINQRVIMEALSLVLTKLEKIEGSLPAPPEK